MIEDLATIERRATELIAFTDGLDDAGMHESARRSRLVARDVLELTEALRAERSGREAAQASYQRCLDLLGERADRAVSEAVDE